MEKLFLKYDLDLMNVTWAHGINSIETLSEVLKTGVDCIETDIIYCHDDELSYNSHPPLYKSDSKFSEFWDIVKESDKILKLDFKMIEAVEPCLKLIDKRDFSRVIINADVLKSSSCNVKCVPYEEFLDLYWTYAPGAHLSIGWTTIRESSIGYTWTDVYEMNKIIQKILMHGEDAHRIITIPVDVHMLDLNSIDKLAWLIVQNVSCRLSLTIWSHKSVPINIECLKAIRRLLKKFQIFIDLPELTDYERDQVMSVIPNLDPIN